MYRKITNIIQKLFPEPFQSTLLVWETFKWTTLRACSSPWNWIKVLWGCLILDAWPGNDWLVCKWLAFPNWRAQNSWDLMGQRWPLQRKPDWITWRGPPSQEGAWRRHVTTRDNRPAESGDKGSSSAASRGGKGKRFLEIEEPPKEQLRYPQKGTQHSDSKPPRDPTSHYHRTRQVWALLPLTSSFPSLQPWSQMLQGRPDGGEGVEMEPLVTPLPPSPLSSNPEQVLVGRGA